MAVCSVSRIQRPMYSMLLTSRLDAGYKAPVEKWDSDSDSDKSDDEADLVV